MLTSCWITVVRSQKMSSDVLSPETPLIPPAVPSRPTLSIKVTAPPQNTEHSDSHRCIGPEPDSSTSSISETVAPKCYPRREHKPPDRVSAKDGGDVVN